MLVLSRRAGEKIVLPGLGVTIEVVNIKSGAVRLGITAPPEVTILRAEVPDRTAEWDGERPQPAAAVPEEPADGRLTRVVRGRLQVARTGMGELRRELQAGCTETAQLLLEKIDEDVALLQQRLETVPREKVGANGRPRRRALLVEDDRNTANLLAECLRLAGLEVDTAGDGVDALQYLRTHSKPDVLLLDMILPRCDGPTTLRAIRRDPAYAGLQIFGLSGCPREEFDLDAGAAGVNGWYQKPVDPHTLLQDLNRALDPPANRLPPATGPARAAARTQATRK
jgi:carbon storage regulator CsrA